MSNLIPNSTQTPNLILDFVIPRISEAEARCLLYICRRTYGFHKERDRISLSQFVEGIKSRDGDVKDLGTGMSRPAVVEALKNLDGAGAIYTIKENRGNFYEINLEMDPEKVVNLVNQLRRLTTIGKLSKPKQGKLLNPQKKGNKEKQSILRQAASKEKSLHAQIIETFHEVCQRSRNVKPVITGADGRNLKRVIDLGILAPAQFEQLVYYFLGSRQYRQFAPSVSTMLSAGILNGLMNQMKNHDQFWKELDEILVRYGRPRSSEQKRTETTTDFMRKMNELKLQFINKMGVPG